MIYLARKGVMHDKKDVTDCLFLYDLLSSPPYKLNFNIDSYQNRHSELYKKKGILYSYITSVLG